MKGSNTESHGVLLIHIAYLSFTEFFASLTFSVTESHGVFLIHVVYLSFTEFFASLNAKF
ncbi:MAG TPA: hypothetical protein VK175_19375 [Leadbetterella sp.]|nr:hypothetical protein [Leadbetterella sp.]